MKKGTNFASSLISRVEFLVPGQHSYYVQILWCSRANGWNWPTCMVPPTICASGCSGLDQRRQTRMSLTASPCAYGRHYGRGPATSTIDMSLI
jgi:hypothetical protein